MGGIFGYPYGGEGLGRNGGRQPSVAGAKDARCPAIKGMALSQMQRMSSWRHVVAPSTGFQRVSPLGTKGTHKSRPRWSRPLSYTILPFCQLCTLGIFTRNGVQSMCSRLAQDQMAGPGTIAWTQPAFTHCQF